MKAVSVAQMRELERIAIEEYRTPALLLMENAAAGFVSALQKEFGSVKNRSVQVFCGGGNNGGDGFAIARMLYNLGAIVSVTLLTEESRFTKDAKTNFDIVTAMSIPLVASSECAHADLIVDAIFGTGFHGETEGNVKDAIEKINNSNAFVASVDVPSGVSAETGDCASVSVFCDLCVTFCAVKKGLLLFPAKNHYKTLVKTDISVPKDVINGMDCGYDVIDQSKKALLPPRYANSHKGSFGKAVAFVGSKGMSGAAYLSVSSILKAGAGMATAAIPEEILPHLASQFRAVMTLPLPCENGVLSKTATAVLENYTKGQNVILAGCGLGVSENARHLLMHLIKTTDKPMVIDADGLNMLTSQLDALKAPHSPIIVTPHVLEFSRLSGLAPEKIKADPLACAAAFAKAYDVTVVLKDAVTVVCAPDGRCAVSAGTNSGLATAGSGDVLSGIITGILAQGASCYNAAVCGVYLHLAAGHLAREAFSEYSMTAEDLLTMLPDAFKKDVSISPNIKEL